MCCCVHSISFKWRAEDDSAERERETGRWWGNTLYGCMLHACVLMCCMLPAFVLPWHPPTCCLPLWPVSYLSVFVTACFPLGTHNLEGRGGEQPTEQAGDPTWHGSLENLQDVRDQPNLASRPYRGAFVCAIAPNQSVCLARSSILFVTAEIRGGTPREPQGQRPIGCTSTPKQHADIHQVRRPGRLHG
jgi:hypothetical protein